MGYKYDMPTNEGCIALARSIASNCKIAIRGAQLCNYTGDGMANVSAVAKMSWSDLNPYKINGAMLSCTSYLPSLVNVEDSLAALDLEFTYMPTGEVTYNTIAVLADVYYAIIPFKFNTQYRVGDVVYTVDNSSNYSYYKCLRDLNSGTTPPLIGNDWESVTVSNSDNSTYGDLQYATITNDPIVLYISRTISNITVGPHIELNYKVRLFLDGINNSADAVRENIIFDTLGIETFMSTELDLLAKFSEQLRYIRDVASSK